jgi:transposase
MADIQAIRTLHASGNSDRRISALLGVHRETVAKHTAAPTGLPNAPTGAGSGVAESGPPEPDGGVSGQNRPDQPSVGAPPTGSEAEPNASTGPPSSCAAHQELIERKLQQGLSAQRIHQDLIDEVGYRGSYYSVRRFVARLQQRSELPVRRLEVGPGEEAQIDFGSGALVRLPDGKTRRPWVFRVVLSFSRKAYSEVVWRQTTESFIGALENAFQHFGGVPQRLVIDNLKAAVHRGDWYDPEVHPKLQSFAAHSGTVFLPTKPYTPRHKGKIERGIGYVKNNALKARVFESLVAQNEFLVDWEASVADTRIHGTTKRQVAALFELERSSLLPLPSERFPCFQEARRAVHKDGHLEVDKAYDSAPPEYVGRRLWVRWDSRLVRIFNDRWEQLAVHAKAEPGRFRTAPEHIPQEKVSAVERGTSALLRQIAAIGPSVRQWYLFEIIMRRHEVKSTLMTSNRPLEDWGKLIGDVPAATAILDRFLQAAEILEITGKSYRLRGGRGGESQSPESPES